METQSPSQILYQNRKLRNIELKIKSKILSEKRKLRRVELKNIKIQVEKRNAEIEVEMQIRKKLRLENNIILRKKIDLIHANATVFNRILNINECEDIDFVSTLYLPHGFTRIEKTLSSTRKVNCITSSTIFVKDEYEFNKMINESLENYKYIHDIIVYKMTHKMRVPINDKTLKMITRDIIDTEYRKIVHHVIFSNFRHELNDDCINKIVGFL